MTLTGEVVKSREKVLFPLEVNGHVIGSGRYIADFEVMMKDGSRRIVDCAGFKKRTWQRDLVMALYGPITESAEANPPKVEMLSR